MKQIKLMPDYGCSPLWADSGDEVGNISPDELPITDDLRAELNAWASTYDATLNMDDPLASGFSNPDEEAKFVQTGNTLATRLKLELGTEYIITMKI